VSIECKMAAHDDFNIPLVLQLLDVLSSSSSSSDEDEVFAKIPHKIPKIENFINVVHNLTDKDVSRLLLFIIIIYYLLFI